MTSPVPSADTRRRFLAAFTSVGLGGTLAPGVAWSPPL
jgi:hypothetical protein